MSFSAAPALEIVLELVDVTEAGVSPTPAEEKLNTQLLRDGEQVPETTHTEEEID